MADTSINNDDFFLGIMVLKNKQWVPHSKFSGNEFGRALMKAEDVDSGHDIEGTKVVRISKKTGDVDKEMWVSPRLQARIDASKAKQLRDGVQKTNQSLSAARKASFKK